MGLVEGTKYLSPRLDWQKWLVYTMGLVPTCVPSLRDIVLDVVIQTEFLLWKRANARKDSWCKSTCLPMNHNSFRSQCPKTLTFSHTSLTFFRSLPLIYRQGRVFARLLVQGFNNSKDPRLGVEFAGR